MSNSTTLPVYNVIETADLLYRRRGPLEPIQQSVELLNAAIAGEQNYEFFWRLARAHFFLGQQANIKGIGERCFQDGIKAGDAAVNVKPTSVEGHFWLGVNLALLLSIQRHHTDFRNAIRTRPTLRRALEIDPAYHDAGALRVLGRLNHKLPFLFGSKKRARDSYEQALAIAPNNSVTRIYFAELLMDMKDVAAAHEQLVQILDMAMNDEWAFEITRDQAHARTLLSRIRKPVVSVAP